MFYRAILNIMSLFITAVFIVWLIFWIGMR